MRRASRVGALATASVAWGCAVGPAPEAWDPAFAARQAELALQREDYDTARARLLRLAGQCEAGEYGRRALLLWAASEVDPGNASASPRMAAYLAGAFLLLPYARPDERVLARTLYRVAADFGGLTEPAADSSFGFPRLASRFDLCDAGVSESVTRSLPSVPLHTRADMAADASALAENASALAVSALEASLAGQADSIEVLNVRAAAQRARIADLERELERITSLLTSGSPPPGL